jgi:hypothetical protein
MENKDNIQDNNSIKLFIAKATKDNLAKKADQSELIKTNAELLSI